MRFVFVGAGAIGSAVGGLLAQRGSDVLLVARGEHARSMMAGGLTVRCPDTRWTLPVTTVTGPDHAHLTVDDVLVLTTKTHQAEAAVEQWADVPVHDRTGAVVGFAGRLLPILTALNGVASEAIALRYFERVFAVCVWFPTVMTEPGEVIVRTVSPRGVFHVGRYGASPDPAADARLVKAIGEEWGAVGLRIVRSDEVMRWKHRKLLANLGNVLQALLGDASGAGDIRRAAEDECRQVFDRAGIEIAGDEESRTAWGALVTKPVPGEPAQLGGSSWQSLVRGTGTIETSYLNGEIALIARRIGQPAPVNTALTALARRAAREGLRPGSLTAEDLRTHLGQAV
ncbi:ketopantoate reductase family protein [Pseudonocardia spinosispora]|uniref:ketopantoate reductase family protein n=1 Tax=Pseudonocardia spinosispora TaxID=103441 RepID=UPI0004056383|nr:2-dehydropantoate 2-reductase N-terminal domain-containing protein [Pseudonocardia spinosispora]